MRLSRITLIGALLLGALLWALDALVDWFVFYEGSLLELALTDVPPHELWVRSLTFAVCLILGGLLAWLLDHRERHEQAMRERLERFQVIADNTIDVIWTMTPDLTFTWVNQAIEDAAGYTPEEWIGTSLADHATPEDLGVMLEQIQRAIGEGPPGEAVIFETSVLHRDGHPIPVEITGRPIFDAEGRPVELQGVARDITDRRRAEEAVARSEALLRQLLDATPQVAALLLPDGTVVACNEVFAHHLGTTPEEITGRPALDHIEEPAASIRREKLEAALAEREPVRWVDQRGGRWFDNRVYPVVDPDGNVTYAAIFSYDITAHRKAEEALRQSEARFRELADMLPQVVFETDTEGDLTWANRFAFELFGYEPPDLEAGLNILDMIAEQDRARAARAIQQRVAGEANAMGQEYLALRPNGTSFPVLIYSTPVVRDGETVGLRGILADITDLKEAQRALRESEQRYRELVQNASDIIYTLAPDGTITSINSAVERITGHSPEDLVGKGIEALLGERGRERVIETLSPGGAAHQGVGATQELEIESLSGDPIVLEINTTVTRAEDGQPSEIIGIARDITERKHAEERLRERSEIIRQTHDLILITDLEGTIIDANDAEQRLLGYDRRDLIGRTIHDLGDDPEAGAAQEEILQQTLEHGYWRGEVVNFAVDGEPIILDCRTFVLEDENGAPTRLIGISRDITERVRAEEALEQSRERYRTVFENTGTATCLVEADGTISLANDGFAALAGVPREEIEGKLNYADFLAPHEVDRMTRYHTDRRTAGRDAPRRYEFDFVDRNGETRRVFLHIDVIPGTETSVASLVDVTDLRRAQNELHALTEELEDRVRRRTADLRAANAELEAFAYSVSHDLRAPLRSIDGFSRAVLEDCGAALDKTARDHLRRVRAASRRMGELIDDLLELSRITRAELRLDRVDMAALAAEIVDDLRASDPDRSVEVIIEQDMTVDADRRLLRTALRNLLENAWKFTHGREQPRVEFGSRRDSSGRTVYYVSDNGASFDPQYRHKLFQPFQRLHCEDDFPGTGVGLATVHRVIRRHGGEVWARGEPARGATFYFTLHDE